jgi:hypothetical protein
MRTLVIAACVLVVSFSSLLAGADSCKPDVSTVDKITKQQQDLWTQKISATDLGSRLMGSSDVSISITVGRYGSSNAVSLEILKVEAKTSASFESSIRAVKGNRFFLGFKNGGEPLSFVATDVGNETKTFKTELQDVGKHGVATTVVLSSAVSDETLATMRKALTTRQVDAIRLKLAGDLLLEMSIDDKSGKKVMAKFQCFYESVDKITALAKDPAMAAARGRYLRKGKNTDFLELNPDGTWNILQNGHSAHGNYKTDGDALTMLSTKMKVMGKGTVIGNTIKDDEGIIWEKQAEAPKIEAPKVDTTVTLRLGMTPEQVEAVQGGKPQKVIDLGSKKTYVYPDMKIIFVDGKVTDIQ